MRINIVNRKYILHNKVFRFHKLINGYKIIGFKIGIFNYEIRFYYN